MITYIKLLQVIENFAEAHGQIQRFKSDFDAQLNQFTTADNSFPVMYVSPVGNYNPFNDFATERNITIRVYGLDVIDQGRENVNNILNNTDLFLNDLYLYLKDGEIPGIEIISDSNSLPLDNFALDGLAGWYKDIVVLVDSPTICDIPFENSPIVPTGCNDITYSSWVTQEQFNELQEQVDDIESFTCSLLETCEVFTDLQDDVIGLSASVDTNITNITNNTTDISTNTTNIFGITSSVLYTIEMVDALTVDFYAPYDFVIDSIDDVVGTASIVILDDGATYSIGNTIDFGSTINITADVISVINLNGTK